MAPAAAQLRSACATERAAAVTLTGGDGATFTYLTDEKSPEVAQLSAETSVQFKGIWQSGSRARTRRMSPAFSTRGCARSVGCCLRTLPVALPEVVPPPPRSSRQPKRRPRHLPSPPRRHPRRDRPIRPSCVVAAAMAPTCSRAAPPAEPRRLSVMAGPSARNGHARRGDWGSRRWHRSHATAGTGGTGGTVASGGGGGGTRNGGGAAGGSAAGTGSSGSNPSSAASDDSRPTVLDATGCLVRGRTSTTSRT